MDARGLRYYLPVKILARSNVVDRIMLYLLTDTEHPPADRTSAFAELLPLLTRAQKDCLLHFYRLRAEVDPVDFWLSTVYSTFEDDEAPLLPRLMALLRS